MTPEEIKALALISGRDPDDGWPLQYRVWCDLYVFNGFDILVYRDCEGGKFTKIVVRPDKYEETNTRRTNPRD